mmetsp:Transcript_100567/g.199782  ORF Transcript_100567/g.199782 Transcript_100567/m.199782 type:complete len:227 (+) Transcript_100567:2497-3177(+)
MCLCHRTLRWFPTTALKLAHLKLKIHMKEMKAPGRTRQKQNSRHVLCRHEFEWKCCSYRDILRRGGGRTPPWTSDCLTMTPAEFGIPTYYVRQCSLVVWSAAAAETQLRLKWEKLRLVGRLRPLYTQRMIQTRWQFRLKLSHRGQRHHLSPCLSWAALREFLLSHSCSHNHYHCQRSCCCSNNGRSRSVDFRTQACAAFVVWNRFVASIRRTVIIADNVVMRRLLT